MNIKIYKCAVCHKEFKHPQSYYSHLNIHSTPSTRNDYKCSVCDKFVRLKGNLKKHLRTHSRTKEELEQLWNNYQRPSGRSGTKTKEAKLRKKREAEARLKAENKQLREEITNQRDKLRQDYQKELNEQTLLYHRLLHEAKSKLWCNCGKEATYYCCW